MSETPICPKCGGELPENAPSGICPRCLMGAALDSVDAASVDGGSSGATPQSSGFAAPTPADLQPHFPQLEILELIGQGGMGAVYTAQQTKLGRLVALKVMRPESGDEFTFAERFNREARTLARLNHPNIVTVHDFGEVSIADPDNESGGPRTLYFFLMEYVDGANLRRLIQGGELKPEEALAIVPQICAALQYAHDAGIVHRDIKPENLLLDRDGTVKIADFGLAKLAPHVQHDRSLTGTHQVMGTPRYMAPEQMKATHTVDHRADIYSLGVVFYEMLTGELPVGQFEPPSTMVHVDVRLDEVVLRSLARDPERRYQKASEIQTEVEAVAGTDPRMGARMGTDSPAMLCVRPKTITIFAALVIIAAWSWTSWTGYVQCRRLAHRYAPSTYSFRDGTPKSMGFPLQPRSKAYRHIHVDATGRGRSQGTHPRWNTWPRQKIIYQLVLNDEPPIHNKTSDLLFSAGRIEIDLVNGTAFRYRDSSGKEVSGNELTEEVITEWMRSIGVDVETVGVKGRYP